MLVLGAFPSPSVWSLVHTLFSRLSHSSRLKIPRPVCPCFSLPPCRFGLPPVGPVSAFRFPAFRFSPIRVHRCPSVVKLAKTYPKTRPRAPILFISGFLKATYKYFKYFGPWTAFVQGPLP